MLAMKLGLAGTAKNTGKTTTVYAIMEELRLRNIPFYLTSIGYDGENFDNITSLPKPKLRVEKGDIIATAYDTLQASTASFTVLHNTQIKTPLGKISIVKVVKPGLVVTAGPNKSAEVREIANILNAIGPGVILFDGALSRIAPMVETDGFILATGASKTPDINKLALETEMVASITSLPKVPKALTLEEKQLKTIALLDERLNILKTWPQTSLIKAEDARTMLNMSYENNSYFFIPGIISKKALEVIAEILPSKKDRLILTFMDPIKLLVANAIQDYHRLLIQIEQAGAFVGVVKRIPLLAVTVNPFYPEYRFETKTYSPAYVDFMRLQVAVQNRLNVPVYNVVRQSTSAMVDLILASASRWEDPNSVYFT